MDSVKDGGADLTPVSRCRRSPDWVPGLDLQLAELIETVWACERTWNVEQRLDAAIAAEEES
jgi:hypothetical protein